MVMRQLVITLGYNEKNKIYNSNNEENNDDSSKDDNNANNNNDDGNSIVSQCNLKIQYCV